jgi:hypothetical protein|tara:strand:+ start:4081 stop:4431 length:351 start_codon:yes stop_codon:yes gene_type:complete
MDKDGKLLSEAYETIYESIHELVDTPDGTIKFKLHKDLEWEEWQVRVLKSVGGQFVDLGDEKRYHAHGGGQDEKQDAFDTMKLMADELRKKHHAKEGDPRSAIRQPNPNLGDYTDM